MSSARSSEPAALERSGFTARLGELSRASDGLWLLGTATGLAFTLISALFFPYPASPSGKFWAYAGLFIRAACYLSAGDVLRRRGGETLSRLFALGIVAGAFELLVDWGLIHWVSAGRLVYLTGNDVVLLGSPVWMPLAWACVIVEIGYPAVRLYGLWRAAWGTRAAALAASLLCATGAGVTVGFYEYFAFRAGWWKYEPARVMLGDYCAMYIPVGEFFMFLAVLPIAARAIANEERPVAAAMAGGARFATAIAAGYALAYALLEGWGR